MAKSVEPSEFIGKINKGDLTEIKSFARPPPAVLAVIKAVCIMLGHDVSSYQWKDCSRVLGDMTFLEKLEDCEPTPEAIKRAKEVLGDTTEDKAMMCSRAAGSLFNWLQAMFSQ